MPNIAVTQCSDEFVYSELVTRLTLTGGYEVNAHENGTRKTADLHVITEKAAEFLKADAIKCRVALIPGDLSNINWSGIDAESVVTYGMNSKNSVTFSSTSNPVMSVQRELITVNGAVIEEQEMPVALSPLISGVHNLAVQTAMILIGVNAPE